LGYGVRNEQSIDKSLALSREKRLNEAMSLSLNSNFHGKEEKGKHITASKHIKINSNLAKKKHT
jgi:hypothetical protein